MRFLPLIFFLLTIQLHAQQYRNNFYEVDRKVKSISGSRTDSLAAQLAALGKTEREKVRAIFRWITEHVDYNVKIFNRNKNTPGLFYEEPDDSSAALPSLNERIAAKVLYKRIAFCDGYSRLFKTLCDHAGIKSEIITGYARTNTNRSGRFGVNHTWNAVYLDSTWHLLDVTWASGFISYSNEYIKQFNDFYFLTPPENFIRDHYPEDPEWTLLADPPFYREFNQSAFRHGGYNKNGVTYYTPQKGILEVAVGDSVQFELKTKREVKNLLVGETFNLDSSQFFIPTPFGLKNGSLSFTYNITLQTGNWLYIFCNEEPVLRYRLNVKKDLVREE